jgi:nucleoside-diphosphate-sugar epimerase
MDEHSPLAAVGRKGRVRVKMWQDALHSGVRTFEARGSDYIGAGAAGIFSSVILPAVRRGGTAWVPGDPDLPHSYTYTGDMARTLVTLAGDERAYGSAWHVPSPAPVTVRQLADRYSALTGSPRLKVRRLPRFVMRTAGLVAPMAREVAEMDYQWYRPFVLDSTLTQATFGLAPTDLDQGILDIIPAADATAARRM